MLNPSASPLTMSMRSSPSTGSLRQDRQIVSAQSRRQEQRYIHAIRDAFVSFDPQSEGEVAAFCLATHT